MLQSCGLRRNSDGLLWSMNLSPHLFGDFSVAVIQANNSLEDQSQVFTSESATYVGVFDGHGGTEASRFVNKYLLPYIRKFAKEQGGLSADAIKKAFNATEEDFTRLVKQTMTIKPQVVSVGTCCLVGAISDGKLYVANLGDSRAVLGKRGLDDDKNTVVPERLSTDHNVSCEDVRREVEALHPNDSTAVIHYRGVWRIKGIIQVSRSIGDVYLKKPEFNRFPILQQYGNPVPMKQPFISAIPSIVTRKLSPRDLFIIFASDGLWENLTDEAAVQIVSKYPRSGIAKRLAATAIQEAAKKREMRYKDIKKIEKGTRRHFHDDITVIVIYLDHHYKRASNPKNGVLGCTMSPMDIYSQSSSQMNENSRDPIFDNEDSP